MDNHEIKLPVRTISPNRLKKDLLKIKNDFKELPHFICDFVNNREVIQIVEKIARELKMKTVFIFGVSKVECYFYW